MMRHFSRTAGLLGLLAVLAACGQPGSGPEAPAQLTFRSVGTAPPGGAFFVVGGALSEILNQYRGENNWQFTAEATKGSQENIRRLASGELDLALSNAAVTYFAVRGEEGWDRQYPLRTVMTLAPNVAMFVTAANSGIREIGDLQGKRVVVGVAGAGFEFFIRPLLSAHGVTYDDFTDLYNTQAGAVDMLADGSASAAFLGGAVPTASITQAAAAQEIFLVPFAADAGNQLINDYPFFWRATIPAGTYRGLEEDFEGLNVGSMHLITSSTVDDDFIYQVTRTIYLNREKVTEKHAAGRAINPQNIVRNTGTEFHPGAIRYYREIGIWPAGETADTDPSQDTERP